MRRAVLLLAAMVTAFLSLGVTFFAAESTSTAESTFVTSIADARIMESFPTTKYGKAKQLGAGGDEPRGSGKDKYGLLRWDLAGIAPGTKVSSASVTLTVSNSSPQAYEAYALKRAWAESEVTWNSYAAGKSWEVAGAKGSLDREATVAGTLTPSSTGERTFALSAAVVQRWVDDPATNHGIIVADAANSDGFDFYSRESTTSSQRPRLAVTLEGEDIASPETTIGSGPTGTVSDSSASFAFSSSEANSTFECSLDGDAFASCGSPKSYTNLLDGPHTFRVRATDAASNTDATPASRAWTVDTAAPDTTIDSGPSGTITVADATFRFSSEAGATFECRLDGAAYSACTSPKSYTNLSSGSHTFDVRAKDGAGNVDATPASGTFTVDVPPPPQDTTPPETIIDSGPSEISSNASASFTFSSNEVNSAFECRLDGGAFSSCTSPKGYDSLADGSHTFEVRATDTAGNTDATPASRAWTVDTTLAQNDPVLVGAGDIADDLSSDVDDNHTAQLIQTRWPEASVFAAGDLAYEHGTLAQFNTHYHDSDILTQYAWGESLNDQIRPVPGNHEYSATQGTPYAEGYFAYFNQHAIPVSDGPTNNRGYYYYDLGSHWRVFALNTGNTSVVATGTSSPQYAWLEARLKEADAQGKNVVAYFHHPLYSSGLEHGWRESTSTNKLSCSAPSIPFVKPLWDLLYKYGADLIIQGHDHSYERFVPINPDSTTIDANGPGVRPNPISSFVVGTGGKNLKPNGDKYPTDYNGDCGPLRPQSAKFLYDQEGVLKLTLHQSGFDYEYVQTTDGTDAIVADSGTGVPANP